MFHLFRKKKGSPITINLRKDAFYINGVALEFPTNRKKLYELLGKPSRTGKTEKTQTPIDCWDSYGIYANYANASHILSILLITGRHTVLQLHPTYPFSGDVLVEDKPMEQYRVQEIAIGSHLIRRMGWNPNYKEEVPKNKYFLKGLDEEQIEFINGHIIGQSNRCGKSMPSHVEGQLFGNAA